MKAQLLNRTAPVEENPLELVDLPVPEPAEDQIRLRIQACGICHTDLHTVEGELSLPKLPVVPGHQIVGVVDAAGSRATRLREGDQVGVAWLSSTCGTCRYCLSGRENLCGSARFTGYHVDGGYAEYAVASRQFVYPIPRGFSALEAAPLLCGGVIGYRALRLSEAKEGERLGLYGFGSSAHIVIQVALHRGMEVYVYTRGPEHQELARRLGAVWAGRAEQAAPESLDSAIIFAPAGPLVPQALRALRRGGTVALAGIYMSSIPEMDYSLLYGERGLRSVANSTRQDAEELLALAPEIPIRTEVQVFPLEEANHALRLLKGGDINGAGVLSIA